jgi:hypothetical protein
MVSEEGQVLESLSRGVIVTDASVCGTWIDGCLDGGADDGIRDGGDWGTS